MFEIYFNPKDVIKFKAENNLHRDVIALVVRKFCSLK